MIAVCRWVPIVVATIAVAPGGFAQNTTDTRKKASAEKKARPRAAEGDAYRRAFSSFDRIRMQLYLIRSCKRGYELLHELVHSLIDVRRALFELERQQKAGRKLRRRVPTPHTLRVAASKGLARGSKGYIRIGNEWICFEGENTFLSTASRAAIDNLQKTRQRLAVEHDTTEARKAVDEITRHILAARRALWKQARAAARR